MMSAASAQDAPPPPIEANPLLQWQQKQGISTTSPPPALPSQAAPGPTASSPPPPLSVVTTDQIPSNPFLAVVPQPPLPPPANRKSPLPETYDQSQQTMLNMVPPAKTPMSPEASAAFNAMLQQNMPLSPQQVIQLHQQIDLAQRAASVPANIPPKPVSTTLMINLAPGTTPPAVRLALGYVSSLVFVDSTGSPWPIAAFDIGNPKAVNLQWDGKSNILLLQAVSPYSDGDIVIRLVGLATPITLELVSGQRVVDYRVDIHVSGIGPNTNELPIGTALPNSANQLLLGVLDGVAPAGSKTLIVHGAECMAWLLGEKIYLRTRLTVLSPGWMGKMVSPDGMQAYELPKTSSVLVSKYGEPAELKVEGF
jgi:intracellular multiplication protein IcmK